MNPTSVETTQKLYTCTTANRYESWPIWQTNNIEWVVMAVVLVCQYLLQFTPWYNTLSSYRSIYATTLVLHSFWSVQLNKYVSGFLKQPISCTWSFLWKVYHNFFKALHSTSSQFVLKVSITPWLSNQEFFIDHKFQVWMFTCLLFSHD